MSLYVAIGLGAIFLAATAYVAGIRAGLRMQLHQFIQANPAQPAPALPTLTETLMDAAPKLPEKHYEPPLCSSCKLKPAMDAWGKCSDCDVEELTFYSAEGGKPLEGKQ